MIVYEVVEVGACPIQSLVGVGEDSLWCLEAVLGAEVPAKAARIDAGEDADLAERGGFDQLPVVAAVHQVHADALPILLGQEDTGVVLC